VKSRWVVYPWPIGNALRCLNGATGTSDHP
jgi:hypothetical protein